MTVTIILAIGAILGALDGGGIFFAEGEPYKIEIFIAATLKGMLVSFVTAITMSHPRLVWQGALVGGAYGLAIALVVFFAKGAFRSGDAPYILPISFVTGVVNGVLLALLLPN
jgi:uncharacterized membrane protein